MKTFLSGFYWRASIFFWNLEEICSDGCTLLVILLAIAFNSKRGFFLKLRVLHFCTHAFFPTTCLICRIKLFFTMRTVPSWLNSTIHTLPLRPACVSSKNAVVRSGCNFTGLFFHAAPIGDRRAELFQFFYGMQMSPRLFT